MVVPFGIFMYKIFVWSWLCIWMNVHNFGLSQASTHHILLFRHCSLTFITSRSHVKCSSSQSFMLQYSRIDDKSDAQLLVFRDDPLLQTHMGNLELSIFVNLFSNLNILIYLWNLMSIWSISIVAAFGINLFTAK